MSGSNTSVAPILDTPVATIDATGIHSSTYDTILNWFQTQYRGVYGSDVYLENDSQDGQWIAIQAKAFYDAMNALVLVFTSFSPVNAVGVQLASLVEINGLKPEVSTNSQADLNCVATVGVVLDGSIVKDDNGYLWSILGTGLEVPSSGEITVSAQCQTTGAISAAAGSIRNFVTVIAGWFSVTNPAAAVPGAPVESDAALRQRQAVSTGNPAQTPIDALRGAIAGVTGVTRSLIYENDTNVVDANGLPPHTIAAVVEGGVAEDVAIALNLRKTIGGGYYGTTSITVPDAYGNADVVNFFRPTEVAVSVQITIAPTTGYTSNVGLYILAYVVQTAQSLYNIGQRVYGTKLYSAASLSGLGGATLTVAVNGQILPIVTADSAAAMSATYEIISVLVSRDGNPSSTVVPIAFNEVSNFSIINTTLVTTALT